MHFIYSFPGWRRKFGLRGVREDNDVKLGKIKEKYLFCSDEENDHDQDVRLTKENEKYPLTDTVVMKITIMIMMSNKQKKTKNTLGQMLYSDEKNDHDAKLGFVK